MNGIINDTTFYCDAWLWLSDKPLEEDSSWAVLTIESVLPLVPWPKAPDMCRLLLPLIELPTLLLDRAGTGGEENAIDDGAREFTLSTLVYWGQIQMEVVKREVCMCLCRCVHPTELTASEDVVQSADTEEWPLLTWLQEKQAVSQI